MNFLSASTRLILFRGIFSFFQCENNYVSSIRIHVDDHMNVRHDSFVLPFFFFFFFDNFSENEFPLFGDGRPLSLSSVWLCLASILVFSNAVFASVYKVLH